MFPRAWARLTVATVTLALVAGAAGCGGDDAPTKEGFYTSINAFCGRVSAAAKQVSDDTDRIEKDTKASRQKRLEDVTASLQVFAEGTESALAALKEAGAPSAFSRYKERTVDGFQEYVDTLRDTAKESKEDSKVLAKLQSRLDAVKLPEPPKEITKNAKKCVDFNPK